MHDELIKRLRNEAECPDNYPEDSILMREAADAIEELSKKVDEWQEEACKWNSEYYHLLDNMPRWIPVSERLPNAGERVLVFGGVTMYVAYYDKNRYGGESWHKLNSKSHYCNPTHWMPLPEPPEEET